MNLINSLLEYGSGKGTSSTALRPFGWMMGLLLPSTFVSISINAPLWVTVIIVICVCLNMFLYIICSLYFIFRSPDSLRSEVFVLKKMSIEKSLIGDSKSGLKKIDKPKKYNNKIEHRKK